MAAPRPDLTSYQQDWSFPEVLTLELINHGANPTLACVIALETERSTKAMLGLSAEEAIPREVANQAKLLAIRSFQRHHH